MSLPQSGYADVDGATLFYEAAGDGPAVVLLHGFGVDRRMWADQMGPFGKDYRVVAYDLRGFGTSSMPSSEPYSHWRDLAALLDVLGIEEAAVIGSSMGARVAIDFAIAFPRRTSAVVTVAGVPSGFSFTRRQTDSRPGPDRATVQHTLARLGEVRGERMRAMLADYSRWHRHNDDPRRELEPPATERLGAVTAPTLVTVGSDDNPDFAHAADLLVDGIEDSRRHVFAGLGHLPNMEWPDEFNRVVLDFLDTNRHYAPGP